MLCRSDTYQPFKSGEYAGSPTLSKRPAVVNAATRVLPREPGSGGRGCKVRGSAQPPPGASRPRHCQGRDSPRRGAANGRRTISQTGPSARKGLNHTRYHEASSVRIVLRYEGIGPPASRSMHLCASVAAPVSVSKRSLSCSGSRSISKS